MGGMELMENQYQFECGVCGRMALGAKGRCVCYECKEKRAAAEALTRSIDRNLMAHTQEEHDAALKEFMDALDFYLDRQRQSWIR